MLIKPSINSSSLIDITEDSISVASGPCSISAHRQHGVFVNGPFSVSAPPTAFTFGGFFKFNPDAATGMPSTLVTPTPTFEVTVPVKNIAVQTAINSIVVGSITGIMG